MSRADAPPQRVLIDAFKLASGPVAIALIAGFGRWDNPTAWLYAGLHGSYGVLWALKSRVFPDRAWEVPLRPGRALVLTVGLVGYWIAPLLLVAGDVRLAGPWLAAASAVFALGVFLHFAADMQKHVALALQPEHLITDGLFGWLRNPNYLGELLIYASFALLAWHPVPFAVLAIVVAVEWIPNIRRKDRSLSRYPEFEAYRERTWRLIPFVW